MAIRVEVKRHIPTDSNRQVHAFVAGGNIQAVVVDEKPGTITRLDKAKGYYKGLIVLVGSLLVAANKALPLVPDEYKNWVSGAIGVLTIAGVVLKANETWIDSL